MVHGLTGVLVFGTPVLIGMALTQIRVEVAALCGAIAGGMLLTSWCRYSRRLRLDLADLPTVIYPRLGCTWRCPRCGSMNVEPFAPSELNAADREEIAEQCPALAGRNLFTAPRIVSCRLCNTAFGVHWPHEAAEDDSDE